MDATALILGCRRAWMIASLVALTAIAAALAPVRADASMLFGAASIGVGAEPFSVASADFDGDGVPDLVVSDLKSDQVSVLLGTGTGSFAAAREFAAGPKPTGIATGDWNRDGVPDLAVADSGSDSVAVMLGSGDGSFGPPTPYAVGGAPESVAGGDFNGDGIADLAVTNLMSNSVSVLLGTGDGGFGAATEFSVGFLPTAVAIGDFDADGTRDLAVANGGSKSVSVLLGTGTGGFGAATEFAIGSTMYAITVADFNRDGKQDLAVPGFETSKVSILLGAGTGSFAAPLTVGAGGSPVGIDGGDFNRDGIPDLAVAGYYSDLVSILLGNGTGTFTTAGRFEAGRSPRSLLSADFNRDGALDVATADSGSGSSTVMLSLPTADASTSSLSFESAVALGATSAPLVVTLTNHGSARLLVNGFSFSGPDPGDFRVASGSCEAPVPPGGSCTVSVSFAPQGSGERSAILVPATNAAGVTEVRVAGTGGPVPQVPAGQDGAGDRGGERDPRGPAAVRAIVPCKATRSETAKQVEVTCRLRSTTASIATLLRGGHRLARRSLPAGTRRVVFHVRRSQSGGKYRLIIEPRAGVRSD